MKINYVYGEHFYEFYIPSHQLSGTDYFAYEKQYGRFTGVPKYAQERMWIGGGHLCVRLQ